MAIFLLMGTRFRWRIINILINNIFLIQVVVVIVLGALVGVIWKEPFLLSLRRILMVPLLLLLIIILLQLLQLMIIIPQQTQMLMPTAATAATVTVTYLLPRR